MGDDNEVGFTRRMINSITEMFYGPEIEEEQIELDDEIVLQDIEKQSVNKKYRPKRNMKANENGSAPDGDLFANKFARLRSGVTAYYIIDPPPTRHSPKEVGEEQTLPVILCLHGMTNSSYMYRDVAEILAAAAKCRVVAFDFYGRGRSAWTGSACTLDLFVTQAKELLDELGIKKVFSCIGFDMGAAVAIGLLAKHYNRMPKIIHNIVLISPIGILEDEYEISHKTSLKPFIFGELYMVFKYKPQFAKIESDDYYYNASNNSYHYPMIAKANRMIDFQLASTPGYIGAYISTLRHFPFARLKELYYVLGQDTSTPICLITGADDKILPVLVGDDFDDIASDTFEMSVECNNVHRLAECGHNPVIEKFNEVMELIVDFYRHDEEFNAVHNINTLRSEDSIRSYGSGGENTPRVPSLVFPLGIQKSFSEETNSGRVSSARMSSSMRMNSYNKSSKGSARFNGKSEEFGLDASEPGDYIVRNRSAERETPRNSSKETPRGPPNNRRAEITRQKSQQLYRQTQHASNPPKSPVRGQRSELRIYTDEAHL